MYVHACFWYGSRTAGSYTQVLSSSLSGNRISLPTYSLQSLTVCISAAGTALSIIYVHACIINLQLESSPHRASGDEWMVGWTSSEWFLTRLYIRSLMNCWTHAAVGGQTAAVRAHMHKAAATWWKDTTTWKSVSGTPGPGLLLRCQH